MKIVFMVMRFRKDGLTNNVLDLTRGLVQKGHKLHYITSGFRHGHSEDKTFFDTIKNELDSLGVVLHYFNEPKGKGVSAKIQSAFSFFKVLSLILKIQADVIHCHSPNLTFLPWLLGKRYVSTVHADTIRPSFRYKHPDLLIAVSEGAKAFTEIVMGTDPKTIRTVHHGISERFADKETDEDLISLKVKHGIPEDKLILGVVGRITPLKGTDTLLNALGKFLSKKNVSKIHLVFVGDYLTSNDKEWFQSLVKANGLENQITLVPFTDPKPYYQMFDVFVLPSRSDTFGLVAVEAMMSGCCTIRSNSNGATDQIDHGTDGLIFQMEDSKALASLIDMVMNDENYRLKLAQSGKEKALSLFTKDRMVQKTIEVYEELKNLS